jgi:hypothetical protein
LKDDGELVDNSGRGRVEVSAHVRTIAEARMNSVANSVTSPRTSLAILWGGLAAGILDITAALVVYGAFGLRPQRLLQGIAAGLLGPKSFDGGVATAALGLACHFTIAFSAAVVFSGLSRRMEFLVRHFVIAGALYGVAVYFFMNRVVVPLSHARRSPFSFKMMVIGVIIHIFCVGLPIATAVRRFSTPR